MNPLKSVDDSTGWQKIYHALSHFDPRLRPKSGLSRLFSPLPQFVAIFAGV